MLQYTDPLQLSLMQASVTSLQIFISLRITSKAQSAFRSTYCAEPQGMFYNFAVPIYLSLQLLSFYVFCNVGFLRLSFSNRGASLRALNIVIFSHPFELINSEGRIWLKYCPEPQGTFYDLPAPTFFHISGYSNAGQAFVTSFLQLLQSSRRIVNLFFQTMRITSKGRPAFKVHALSHKERSIILQIPSLPPCNFQTIFSNAHTF